MEFTGQQTKAMSQLDRKAY